MRVSQQKFDDAEKRRPKFVLVLDYSGSMHTIMAGGGGQSAIQVLEGSVANLLAADLVLDAGDDVVVRFDRPALTE